jgi:hypothetical protein
LALLFFLTSLADLASLIDLVDDWVNVDDLVNDLIDLTGLPCPACPAFCRCNLFQTLYCSNSTSRSKKSALGLLSLAPLLVFFS